jgi:hypothetical protein
MAARRAKRENGGLGEDPPGSTMSEHQGLRTELTYVITLQQNILKTHSISKALLKRPLNGHLFVGE